MNFIYYLILTFLLFTPRSSYSQNNTNQINSENQTNDNNLINNTSDNISYNYELSGNLNPITAQKVKEYLLNKTGIYEANINVYSKKITLITNKNIDKTSVEGLLRYAHHLYLLEDTHKNEK